MMTEMPDIEDLCVDNAGRKVCDRVFVVPCEGSEAEALKYMRGVNLA